jgi:23S rRNA (adenine2030-N6)-methyltransferase
LNYRHIYHAGNFTDVFKHFVLTLLLQHLRQKDKGYAMLDTHAGIGQYDLWAEETQKTGEYLNGIAKLWQMPFPSEGFQPFLSLIYEQNQDGELRYYPGSPLLAASLLRPQDRLILSELHPEDCAILKQCFFANKQVAVHHLDGYLALKAHLPFAEGRGLVLIDPSYEQRDEYQQLHNAMNIAYKRMRNAIYAIWYPIKDEFSIDHFLGEQITNILKVEIRIENKQIHKIYGGFNLKGCGMLIVNPPFGLEALLHQTLPYLLECCTEAGGKSRFRIVNV